MDLRIASSARFLFSSLDKVGKEETPQSHQMVISFSYFFLFFHFFFFFKKEKWNNDK